MSQLTASATPLQPWRGWSLRKRPRELRTMTDYSKWIGRKLTIPDDVAPPGARPYRVEVIRLETMLGAGGIRSSAPASADVGVPR